MYIIKSDKSSTFKNAIDIMDEMTISAVPPGIMPRLKWSAGTDAH
jgi:hypothetical protein